MSASLKPLTLEEFLDWERTQSERYEFDGIQPIPMSGSGSGQQHARVIIRLGAALVNQVKPPFEPLGPSLMVLAAGRARYPDATIVCGGSDANDDLVVPAVVFEVVGSSTALTDRMVKASEYASVPTIAVYVLLEQDCPEVTIRRRSEAWEAETVMDLESTLELPEIGISIPMTAIYGPS
jgi:Uma2 family endonuclease